MSHEPPMAARWGGILEHVERFARRSYRRARSRFSFDEPRLVYHAGYRLPESGVADADRADKIVGHLLREGWLSSADKVVLPRPASLSMLLRVHDVDYLEALDDPQTVARAVGGGVLSPTVAASFVAAQRWATAGTVQAADLALHGSWQRRRVVNLGGGFHHAHAARGEGFCVLSDVAIAIEHLRTEGFTGRTLIVDLDLHHGNGLRGIYAHDPDVWTCSVHAAHWDETPAEAAIDVALGTSVGDATYLSMLRRILPQAFREARPDVVFFVAGVDVAADDALGSWRISADGIAERDRLVFDEAGGTPVVMVLAGGYGPEAWRYTARTLVWLFGGVDIPIPSGSERALALFRVIARSIGRGDLHREDDDGEAFRIRDDDVYGDITHHKDHRILGFYSSYGIELAFERYGLFDHLRARGYPHPFVVIDTERESGQAITVYGDATRSESLIELVVSVHRGLPPFQLLFVEWLLMQDPRARVGADRTLLPGQAHPGLGALRLLVGMLVMACERVGLDGVAFRPAHYHVAAQARGMLRFVDPEREAFFSNLASVLGPLRLDQASKLVDRGGVVDLQTGDVLKWQPALMVLPVSPALKQEMDGAAHAQRVEEAAAGMRLALAGIEQPHRSQRVG
jgi:acetoin utilization deacetylase AcuC-like enzyme